MSILWALAGFFLILTPVILIHELGHFTAARLSKIKVEEFGFGFPPRAAILGKTKGGTHHLIELAAFGWFCASGW